MGTALEAKRSQASARRRTSQSGPSSAAEASAVNVLRGLPLSGVSGLGAVAGDGVDPTGPNVAPMPDSEVLSIERADHVATLWLDRPEARNAMGPAFWTDLPLAMAELGDDRSVAPWWWRRGDRTSAWAST